MKQATIIFPRGNPAEAKIGEPTFTSLEPASLPRTKTRVEICVKGLLRVWLNVRVKFDLQFYRVQGKVEVLDKDEQG